MKQLIPSVRPGICVFVLSSQALRGRDNRSLFPFWWRRWEKSSRAIVQQVDTKTAGVRQPIWQHCIVVALCDEEKKKGKKKAQHKPLHADLLSKDILIYIKRIKM